MRQEKIRLVGALGLLAATAVGLSTARVKVRIQPANRVVRRDKAISC